MDKYISIASLIIALLAVFMGPLITYYVTRIQIRSMALTSNKQIIAPMRQAWINNLRDELAELMSRALHYYVSGFENREDTEYQRLTLIEAKIVLMLNYNEFDHQKLEKSIRNMIAALEQGHHFEIDFVSHHDETMMLSRSILKFEWDRLSNPIMT